MQPRKLLTISVAALLACGTLFPAAAGFAAQRATLRERVAAQQEVEFNIYLPLEHRAQLEKLLAELHNSSSAQYHKWLTPEEFNSRFGANEQSVATIVNELNAYGLKSERVSAQQIRVTGGARAVEQLFLTELHAATFPDGKKTIATSQAVSLPGSMAASGAVVTGLSAFIRVHKHSHRAATAIPENRYSNVGPYWFDDLKQAYQYPSNQVYNGKGVTIGILMTGGYNPVDMTKYFAHEQLPTPKISEVDIAGGAPFDPNNSFETHLDLQQSGGMAPKAHLVLYNIPDLTDNHILAGLTKILDQNRADVVSMSFGGPELGYEPEFNGGQDETALLGVYDDMFARGTAQGITFIASSGDAGALSIPPVCFAPNATSACGSVLASVESPASSPHVTGVGGTNLVTTMSSTSLDSKYVSEAAFDDPLEGDIFYGTPATGSVWGSGGGNSIYYKKPVFQFMVNTGSNYRTVPDVSLHMGGCPIGAVLPCGPERSADIVAIDGKYYGVIGTSASAPDFAGLTALKIQRLGSRLGNENYEIYALALLQQAGGLKVFHDDIPGYNGLYTTRKGYNRVLGNGTVIGINFLLAPSTPVAGTPQTPSNP